MGRRRRMLNREKYAKEIIEIACNGGNIAVVNGKLENCRKTQCNECNFNGGTIRDCEIKTRKWANSEYVEQYVSTTLSDLKFTGYTQSLFGHTNGYYYYTMRAGECVIVLLAPDTSEEGLPSIEEVTIQGKISKGNENFDTLLSNLSTDLNWTENGIRNKVSSYYISEPGFNHVGNRILFAAIFITGIYVSHCLLCICFSRYSLLPARILRFLAIRKKC